MILESLSGCAQPVGHASRPARSEEGLHAVRGAPDGERWLGADGTLARRAGAGDLEVIAVGAGAPGDRISGLIDVPDRSCVLLMARAARSVEDVDLFAYGDDGTVFGSDEASNKTPTVMVCPPHPRRLFVAGRVVSGHGLVAVGAQRVTPQAAASVARALELGAHDPAGPAAWDDLETQLAEHRRRIGGDWRYVRRQAVPLDPRVSARVSAHIERDGCLDVFVLPSPEVSHLEMNAVDSDGRLIGRALSAGRERSLVVCSATDASLTLEVRPHAGRGTAAVVLSRSASGSRPDIDERNAVFATQPLGALEDERARHAEGLERLGYRQRPRWVDRGTLKPETRISRPVDLPSGCARLDVTVGRPARGVDLWLWSGDGTLVAHQRGTGRSVLFACTHGTRARLDLEPLGTPGSYAAELRPEGNTPALLLDHPLASSRLLARMQALGLIKRVSDIGAPRAFVLSPNELRSHEYVLPVGRCLDVVLALGPDASGAEIRVVDADSGQDIALTRGTHSASTKVCALSRPGALNARIELRAAAGRTTGLTATWQSDPPP